MFLKIFLNFHQISTSHFYKLGSYKNKLNIVRTTDAFWLTARILVFELSFI